MRARKLFVILLTQKKFYPPFFLLKKLIIFLLFFRLRIGVRSRPFFWELLDFITYLNSRLQWFTTLIWVQTRDTRWRSVVDWWNGWYDWWLFGTFTKRWPRWTEVRNPLLVTLNLVGIWYSTDSTKINRPGHNIRMYWTNFRQPIAHVRTTKCFWKNSYKIL